MSLFSYFKLNKILCMMKNKKLMKVNLFIYQKKLKKINICFILNF